MKFIPEPDRINAKLITNMKKLFDQHPQIQAVYLFGSQIEPKRIHQESDVDIGIFVDKYDFKLKKDLLKELTMLRLNRIDLVMMEIKDIPDSLLAYEIVKENKLIYQKKDFDEVAFASRIIRMYLDIKPLLERQLEIVKQRI